MVVSVIVLVLLVAGASVITLGATEVSSIAIAVVCEGIFGTVISSSYDSRRKMGLPDFLNCSGEVLVQVVSVV